MQPKALFVALLSMASAIEASAINYPSVRVSGSLTRRQLNGFAPGSSQGFNGGRAGNTGGNTGGNNNAGNTNNNNNNNNANTGNKNAGNTNNNNANTGNNNGNDASVTCLKANALQTGSAGQGALTEAGQAPSATDSANFINFCSGSTLTNGKQVKTGSCNGVVMGKIPASTKMISTILLNPKHDDSLAANTNFNVQVKINNLQAGSFTDPASTYYSAPQDLNGDGEIIGHVHITVEDMGNTLNPTTPLDASKFVFFKGINDAGSGGVLSATVTGGLPPGNYRICTITAAANHQPVLMPVAQRGSQDDCSKITIVNGGGNNNNNNNNNNGNAGNAAGKAGNTAGGNTGNAAGGNKATTGNAGNAAGGNTGNAAGGNKATTGNAGNAAGKAGNAAGGNTGNAAGGNKATTGNADKTNTPQKAQAKGVGAASVDEVDASAAAINSASTSTTAVTATSTATTAPSVGSGGSGGATTNALGGIQAPALTNSGDATRPFSVQGNTFVGKAVAVQRACDIQHNKCADAVNAKTLTTATSDDCQSQIVKCVADLS